MWLGGRGTLNCSRLASARFQTLQTLKYDNLLTYGPYLRHKHENGIKRFICLLAEGETISAFTKMSKCSLRGWRRWLKGRRGFFFSPLRCPQGSRKQWGSVYSQPQSKSRQGISLQIWGQAGLYTHTHTWKRLLSAHASGWCHAGRSKRDELWTSIMRRLN